MDRSLMTGRAESREGALWNIGFLRLPKAAYTQIISPELSVHVGNARLGICLARARWLRRQLKHGCLLPLT